MDLVGGPLLPITWGVLGVTVVACGLLAGRRPRAFRVGVVAVSALWVVGGAVANTAMLLDGETYHGFAAESSIPFVRDTWESLVVPHHHVFIALLIAGQAAAGLLVLVPGRVREVALIALIAFNATLLVFGWAYAFWAVALVTGLSLLLRAERLRTRPRRPSAGAPSVRRHRSPRSHALSP